MTALLTPAPDVGGGDVAFLLEPGAVDRRVVITCRRPQRAMARLASDDLLAVSAGTVVSAPGRTARRRHVCSAHVEGKREP